MHGGDASDSAAATPGNPSPSNQAWEFGFGCVLALFALIALFVWFPRDIASGFIETNTVGKVGPGDAFFPVLLATAILALSVVHLAVTGWKLSSGRPVAGAIGRLSADNFWFLFRFHIAILLGLAAMYGLGPAFVAVQNALTGGKVEYRQLADTVPYKYIGFVAGALLMTLPTIAWAEGRWSARSAVTVLLVVLAIIVIFDVLLTNVQLPPNANV